MRRTEGLEEQEEMKISYIREKARKMYTKNGKAALKIILGCTAVKGRVFS